MRGSEPAGIIGSTMDPVDFFVLVISPALFWAAYLFYKDRYQPEPLRNLLLSYLLGIGAGYLGLHAYAALDLVGLRYNAYELAENNVAGLFVYSILVIGVIEEVVKFLPFWLIGIRLHHFDEPIDGIVYASLVALGFASYENYHYMQVLDGAEAIARGFASPLVHTMFASIWGYTCARAQIENRPLLPAALLGLGIAAFAHGLYDFFMLGRPEWFRFVSALVILVIWVWRMNLIRRLQRA